MNKNLAIFLLVFTCIVFAYFLVRYRTASLPLLEVPGENPQDPSGLSSTTLYKQLNRVKCHESLDYCSEDNIASIWRLCLSKGFATGDPQTSVLSSRNIEVLVRANTYEKEVTSRDATVLDHNGIPILVPRKYESIAERLVYGYCIGSEYIIKP